jgi:hypothetical protein
VGFCDGYRPRSACAWVLADVDDREHVEGGVEAALPTGSRRKRSERPLETGSGAQPARRASWASEVKRVMPAISPMNLAASSTPIPGSAKSCGATCLPSAAILS